MPNQFNDESVDSGLSAIQTDALAAGFGDFLTGHEGDDEEALDLDQEGAPSCFPAPTADTVASGSAPAVAAEPGAIAPEAAVQPPSTTEPASGHVNPGRDPDIAAADQAPALRPAAVAIARRKKADPFARMLAIARSLRVGDYRNTRRLTTRGVSAKLPSTEMTMLMAEIRSATALSAAVLKATLTDARNMVRHRGIIQDLEQIVAAETARRLETQACMMATEGRVFAYADEESSGVPVAEQHHWRPIPAEELEVALLQHYPGHPLVTKKRDRKEIIDRLLLSLHEPDNYFTDVPPGLNLRNGFLRMDPATGAIELVPHSPDHRATFRLDVDYDPDATCPMYDEAMLAMMGGDQNKATALQQFKGATLFGVMPRFDKVRTVWILKGVTGSGKSSVIRLLERFVPADVLAHLPPQSWSDLKLRMALRGARLNTVSELETGGRAIGGAIFKQIASHEPVNGRALYENAVDFTPCAMHLFATNQPPVFGDTDASMERRLAIIEVPRMAQTVTVNPNFVEDLWRLEASGIVNQIARHAQTLVTEGRFTLPRHHGLQLARMLFRGQPHEAVARVWIEPAVGERIGNDQLQAALRVEARKQGVSTAGWKTNTDMKPLYARLFELHGAPHRTSGGKPFCDGVRFAEDFADLLRASGGEHPDNTGEGDSFADL